MASTRRRSILPKTFEVYCGGWLGPSFRVTFDGKKLDHHVLSWNGPEVREKFAGVEPSPEEWTVFWDTLDRIDVWSWGKTYDNLDILDGTQWLVRIRKNGRYLNSHGSNAYPPNGELDETPEFREFRAAVSRLLGS